MFPPRVVVRSLVELLLASAFAAVAADARADSGAACTVESTNPEQKDVTCALDRGDGARRFRFDATFLGGHDDTRASLSATVDGRPYDCAAGSKTSLFGEDGEVHLFCDVDTPGRELRVSIVFTHAQYAGFTLTSR